MSVTFLTNEDRKEMEERSILTTPQELTDEERAQARENIGAVGTPKTATVGQVISVKAVDENGKPKEWKCVDMASGSGGSGMTDEEIATLIAQVQ